MKYFTLPLTLFLSLLAQPAIAELEEGAKELYQNTLKAILADPIVVDSILKQNSQNADLNQSKIDALDKAWRAETQSGGGTMTKEVLSSELSGYLLHEIEKSEGLFSEIFVMDNKGLNVGQSGITSDYWQGDEDKWQQTYAVGADSIHVSEVEFDESTQEYQVQISVSIIDPSTQEPIGAATFGVLADAL